MRFSVELVPNSPLWRLELLGLIFEKIEVNGIWLSEHPNNRSSILVASHLLRTLRSVWIGLGVLNPYIFNPLTIAQVVSTLSEISPNRVYLGIGAGDKTSLEMAGIKREKPLKRVERCVEIVRKLLKDGRYDAHGVRARMDFKPKGEIPIYIGAQGRMMLRLGGKIGDGVLVDHTNLELLKDALHEISVGARSAGRRMEDLDLAAYLTISLGEDYKKALKTAMPYAAYILCGAGKEFLRRLDIEEDVVERVRLILKLGDWERLYRELPPEYVKATTFIGGEGDLREFAENLVDLGYTHIVFGGPFGPRVLKSLRIVERIIRELRHI